MKKKAPENLFGLELVSALKQGARQTSIHQYVPHDKQILFHKSTKVGTLFLGGNRSGKTVGGGTETVFRLRGQHPYKKVPPAPIRARGVAVDIEDGLKKIMLPELAKWLPPSLLQNGSWEDSYDKQSRNLTLANGSSMDFLTYEQDVEKHAGTSRHWLWMDEEAPKDIFNENMLRLVDVGGNWCMTMTPLLGLTWVYNDYYRPWFEDQVDNTGVGIILVSTDDNPTINMATLDMMTSGMTLEEKDARRYGKFLAFAGQVYRQFDEKHIVDSVHPSQFKDSSVIIGMDHGYRNPAAFLFASVDADGNVLVFDEHYQSEWTVDQHAALILDYIESYDLNVLYIIGDPSISQRNGATGTSIQEEYADNGVPIARGVNDRKIGIDRVSYFLDNDKLKITRNCTNLIKEMRAYRWAKPPKAGGNSPREDVQKVNDHACDALRYLIVSRPEEDGADLPEKFTPRFPAPVSVPSGSVQSSDYEQPSGSYHEILGDLF